MNIEDSIYAIIAVSKSAFSKVPENTEMTLELNIGINGTCFFVRPDEFVTAYHVFNSKFFAKNLYFMINSKGKILYDIEFLGEDQNTDLAMGKLANSKISCLSDFVIPQINKNYIAYGFSGKDTIGAKFNIIKKNGTFSIINNDTLILKKVSYKYLGSDIVPIRISSDNAITLKNCNLHVFNKDLEVGFSGGPTLDSNGGIIGFASLALKLHNKSDGMGIIPLALQE